MKQSSRLHQPDIEGSVGLPPFEQFEAFVRSLRPKDGSTEIWFKFGHNKFFVGEFDISGRFKIYTTKGAGADRQRDYEISDGFDRLSRAARSQDGGVFYIPTQPIGAPTKEAVTSTDDIGIELDSLTREEQLERYAEFTRVTGLEWALLLSSGGKSIHAHLKLDEHYPVEQAQYLRYLVILGLRSDPVTGRLHQPMRVPGFWRKEKQAFQELISVSQNRYSPERAIEGLRKWFDHLGWPFPESLGEDWWREKFHPLLKGCAKHTEQYKLDTARELLAAGEATFLAQKAEQKQARESRQTEQRVYSARRQATGETNLVDLVNQTGAQLGSSAFNWTGHNWKFTGDHARGCCPFHQSASGSSAWIAPADNGWTFHCTACTDDKPISPFTYWLYLRDGFNTPYPKGREWVEAAKQFLSQRGVSVPDFAPGQGFGQSQSSDGKGKKQKKTWEQKRAESEDAAAARRKLIAEREETFDRDYWPELKKDFVLTRSNFQYDGTSPELDLYANATHVLQGGLGSGKTHAIIGSVLNAKHRTIVWITTRNGLLSQTRNRAEKRGVPYCFHYQSDVSGIREQLNLDSGLQSSDIDITIYTMADASLKPYSTGRVAWENVTVVVDEWCSVRKTIHQKTESFPEFEEMLRRAGTLIVADAFMGDIDRAIIKKYRGEPRDGHRKYCLTYQQNHKKSPVKIRWVEAYKKRKDDEKANGIEPEISFRHDGIKFELLDEAIAEAREQPGLRAIASDTKTDPKVAADYLTAKGFKVKLCSSETIDSNRGFLADPDRELEGFDWAIYTPTAESGLDIQAPVLSGVMLASGVLDPHGLQQMMGRCRKCPVWTVSSPRFQVGGLPPKLDSSKAVDLAQHFDKLLDEEGLEPNLAASAWQQWDSAVAEVSKAFGSEFLYKLLEYYHSDVETVYFESTADDDADSPTVWSCEVVRVKSEEAQKTLEANRARGEELLSAQKGASTDSEVWDLRLAQLYDKMPELAEWAVQSLPGALAMAASGGEDSDKLLNEVLSIGRFASGGRPPKLKLWRRSLDPNAADNALAAIRERRTVSTTSQAWRNYRVLRLNQVLDLSQLAKVVGVATGKDGRTIKYPRIAHQNAFNLGSPIVQQLWNNFQRSSDLKRLHPEVSDIESFWHTCCRAMSALGYQNDGVRLRVKTETPQSNGRDRNGKERFVYSKTMYFAAWRVMHESGSFAVQEHWEQICSGLDDWIERDRVQAEEYRRKREERREREAA